MPHLLVYLIKVNIAVVAFYLGYFLILRNLTFYTLNRFYLVFAIAFATIYPFINFATFITEHEALAGKVQVVAMNWQAPMTGGKIKPDLTGTGQINHHEVWFYVELAFWVGVVLLFLQLIIRLISVYEMRAQSEPTIILGYTVRKTQKNISPFSFWKSIYLNPDNYKENELKVILAHEQVHVNRWHTLDILLAELSTIFYWFNPGIWLIKKAVRENIEFLTDRNILQMGYDSKAYQYSLLHVNYGNAGNNFVNHFNISTLRKRIIMMNAKTSSLVKLMRYTILMPVLIGLLLVFSVSRADLGDKVFLKKKASTASIDRAGLLSKLSDNSLKGDTDIKKTAKLTNRLPEYPGGKVALNKYLTNNTRAAYRIVDRLPVFPGGQEALNKYLISAIHYPDDAKEKKLQGRVIMSFFVEKDGKLTDVKVLKDIGGGLGAEAVRVLSASPAWIPGSNEGMPMRMNFVMPIVFALNGKIKRMPSQLQLDSAKNPQAYQHVLSMIRKSTNFTTGGFGGADSARQRKPAEIIALQCKMMGIENPLYYLDGKQTDKDILNRIKASDIESVSIYKDADAVKRYGEKAKKGIVIITSKKM